MNVKHMVVGAATAVALAMSTLVAGAGLVNAAPLVAGATMPDLPIGAGAGYSRHEMLALRARRGGKCGIRRRSTVLPTAVSRHVLIDGSRLSKPFHCATGASRR